MTKMKQTEQNNITRRLLALLLALALALGVVCPVFAEDAGEEPSAETTAEVPDEAIHITSQQDLEELALNCRLDTWSRNRTVVLDNDLVLDGDAAEFLPIPTFGGTFEGGGHTISGLALTDSDAGIGLFDTIQQSGTVRGLTVVGQVTPSDGDTVGGIAGKNCGRIVDCAFEGVVEGAGSVGGIVGINETTGQIISSRFQGTITGEHYVGGIAGQNTGSLIQCRNEGDINTTAVEVAADFSDLSQLCTTQSVPAGTDIGGIAGFSSGLIQSCQNSGAVGYEHMGYNVGGIVGRQSGYLDGCTNTGTVNGRKDVGGIAGQLEPQVILRYDEDMLDQLYTELNTLQGMTSQALTDSRNASGALSGSVNTLLGSISTAKEAVGGLSTAMTDWGNQNIGQINDVSARVAWVIGQGENVSGQMTGVPAALEEAASLLRQALETLPGGATTAESAAEEIQTTLDDLELAKSQAQTCADCLGQAVSIASSAVDGGLTEEQLESIRTQLNGAADAARGSADALEQAVTHAQTAIQLLNEMGDLGDLAEPVRQAVELLGQAADQLQSALSSLRGAGDSIQSILSTLADQPAVSFTPVSSDVTSKGDALDVSLSQVISSASGLQSSLSSSTDTMIGDLDAINNQLSVITNLINRNVEDMQTQDENVVEDISDADNGGSTLGRLTGAVNTGKVYGDVNVAGIAGSMSVEYDFDPEDDLTEDGTRSLNFQYKTLAVVTGCINRAEISAKKDYAGGIVGRMDLGAVKNCENYGSVESSGGDYVGGIAGLSRATIRSCYVKCSLSGGDYIGGVLGAGESSAVVSDCRTLVEIPEGGRCLGAVSGTETGSFSGNQYVSDTLAGLGRISYAGQAEPISFDELRAVTGLPQAMTQFTLRFVVEDEEIQSRNFAYGASFGEDVFPDIPVKDGYYAAWDTDDLSSLHFDKTVTAEYTRYVLTLPSEAERENGRPVFLADGDFDADAVLTVTAADPVERVHGKQPLEQWKVQISDTRQDSYTLRYLAPDGDPESVHIYVREDGRWKRAECEVFGSYLVFALPGAEADVAVLQAPGALMEGLVIAAVLLVVLAAALLILRRVRGAKPPRKPVPGGAQPAAGRRIHTDNARSSAAPADGTQQTGEPDRTEPSAKPGKAGKFRKLSKKQRYGVIALAVVLLAALVLVLTAPLRGMADAYTILENFSAQSRYAMTMSTDTQLDGQLLHADFTVTKTQEQGRDVTCVYKDGMSLYYTDGVILMENGKAYQLSDLHPDYSKLPQEAAGLYQTVDFTTSRDGKTVCYTLTAEGENARTILAMLLPGQSDYLTDTHKLTLELTASGGQMQSLRFTSEGTLVDEHKTPYSITAELQPADVAEDYALPQAVDQALSAGLPETQEVIPEDLFRLLCAWTDLNQEESYTADLVLGVDCGPLNLDETLKYEQTFVEDQKIGCVRSGDLAVYFANGQFCGPGGAMLTEAESALAQRIDLLQVLYQICLNGSFDCVDTGNGSWLYTLTLDQDAMKQVALAAAPDMESQPVTLTEGSVQILVKDGSIASIRCACTGGLEGLEQALPVTVSAKLSYTTGSGFEVPAAVQEQLTGKEENGQ